MFSLTNFHRKMRELGKKNIDIIVEGKIRILNQNFVTMWW